MTTRAALYYRQSLDVQEGIERQKARCHALVKARGWNVYEEYVDNDTSATKARGAGTAWAKMLEDAEAGNFDVVVAVDLDRLVRTISDLVTLTGTGVKVLTVDGEIDLTTADGEFRATMLAGIARFEARRKGERQKRATAQAASKGKRTGGRRPFGYEADGVTVNEHEAQAVRQAYVSFLAGIPLAAIARDLNAQGYVTTQKRYTGARDENNRPVESSPWQAYSVRQMLQNPRYAGKRAHLGEVVAEAVWPALVDEATWQAAHSILGNPARRSAPKRGRYLLSGLAVCGVCGEKVHAGGNARKGVPAYRCGGSSGHFARRSEPVETWVNEVIVTRLSRPDARELLTVKAGPDVDVLRRQAVADRARLDEVAVEFANGAISVTQLRTISDVINARLKTVDDQLADAGRVNVLGDLVGANDVAKAWDSKTQDQKRAVIDALATVRLLPVGRGVRNFDPATVQFDWKA